MTFLAFVTCPGCGEAFPVRKKMAMNRAKWCSDRCRKAQYGGTCVDCGAPTNGSNGRENAPERCRSCDGLLAGPRKRAEFLEHKTTVEALWADGWTGREIGEFMGWTVKNPAALISLLRNHRGYDLPHRRTPEQLARITAGSAERMAKARAVYREQRAA